MSTLNELHRVSWRDVLADLRPFPGRAALATQITCAAVTVAAIMLTFRMPFLSIGPYLVFLLVQPGTWLTRMAGVLGAGVGAGTFLLIWGVATVAWDVAWLRIILWTVTFYGGFFLMRALVEPRPILGLLAVTALMIPVFDQNYGPNQVLDIYGWLWAILGTVLAATFFFEWLIRPASSEDSSLRTVQKELPTQMLKSDWKHNPAYRAFALRATCATMGCYLFLSLTDWDGIHTCMITCVVTALSTTGQQMHKQRLRFLGALLGGLAGIAAVIWMVPLLPDVGGFLILLAVGAWLAAWVTGGSERISYAGWQIALAFFMVLLQDPHPVTSLDTIRDRWVGIFLGIFAMRLAFVWILPWPFPDAATSTEEAPSPASRDAHLPA